MKLLKNTTKYINIWTNISLIEKVKKTVKTKYHYYVKYQNHECYLRYLKVLIKFIIILITSDIKFEKRNN